MAKLIAVDMLARVTDKALQAHGGIGFWASTPDRAGLPRRARAALRGGHQRDPEDDHRPRGLRATRDRRARAMSAGFAAEAGSR